MKKIAAAFLIFVASLSFASVKAAAQLVKAGITSKKFILPPLLRRTEKGTL